MVEQPLYVDVNIFVYWLGNHPQFGKTAYKWIKNMEISSSRDYVTSSLTIYETLVIIAGLSGKNLKNKNFTKEVVNALTQIKGLKIEPLSHNDFLDAIQNMNDYKLDFEDSLHFSVAARMDAKNIISNDSDFDSTPIKRII
jgi:predicted nucleic acid-binding protein